MYNFYTNLPQFIEPVLFSIGPVEVRWYSIMWLVAFFIIYKLSLYRISKNIKPLLNEYELSDLFFFALLGAIIGGRIGYIIFYDFDLFFQNPVSIFLPYDFQTHSFSGISGMSYHGGLMGVIIATFLYCRKRGLAWFEVISYLIPAFPLGYFFGRLGNFLNGELYGRETNSVFGMNFTNDGILRYPSQLYEAVFEGLVLFLILWYLKDTRYKKHLASFYLIGYAFFRFFIEYFRQPDEHLGFVFLNFTMGQILCFVMFVCGIGLYFFENVYWSKFNVKF